MARPRGWQRETTLGPQLDQLIFHVAGLSFVENTHPVATWLVATRDATPDGSRFLEPLAPFPTWRFEQVQAECFGAVSSFTKSTLFQNRQLIVLISNSKQQVDDFVGELTF